MKWLVLILVLGFAACVAPPEEEENKKVEKRESWMSIALATADTIPERNSPDNLDMTKHQLFIDTTGNSELLKRSKKWEPQEFIASTTCYYLQENREVFEPRNIDLKSFPAYWISIQKIKDDFFLYDGCGGGHWSFLVTDSTVLGSSSHETWAHAIYELTKNTTEEIEIELREFNGDAALFSIKKTKFNDIYILKWKYDDSEIEKLVIPVSKMNEFDVVVNHCVKMRQLEFDGFDKINYDEY